MSEGKGPIEVVTEESKGLVVEAYKDVARPAAKAIGDALGSVVQLVFAPIKALADTGNAAVARFREKLATKAEGVPPEQLQLPAATVSAPTLQQIILLGPGDDVEPLRDAFANLLMTSMDRERAAFVHPSFVSILSQLTPDEAWLLKSVDRHDYAAFDVFEHGTDAKQSLGIWTRLGRGTGIDESQLPQYISNLDRLGILRIDLSSTATNQADYAALKEIIDTSFDDSHNIWSHGGRILVTPFGEQFLNVCVRFRS